jgi:hypothetical protein
VKNWYDVTYAGQLSLYGVTKEVRAAFETGYYDWTPEKLQKAMREKGRSMEPEMVGLEVTRLERLGSKPGPSGYDKFVDLDAALGI